MMAAGAFPLLGEPPFGLGEEVCGEVLAVGPGSGFFVGDRIMGITAFLDGWGGYAEYAYVLEQSAARVPERFTDEQAGGFPIGFRTAYAGLVERTSLRTGEHLVVLGGAGSSGVAAILLGKALGATVTAVAGSPEKVAFCRSIGADHAVSRHSADLAKELTEATGGHGVDLIYDVVGGETAATAVKALARNGRIAIVGFASGVPVIARHGRPAAAQLHGRRGAGRWLPAGAGRAGLGPARRPGRAGQTGHPGGPGLVVRRGARDGRAADHPGRPASRWSGSPKCRSAAGGWRRERSARRKSMRRKSGQLASQK